MITLKEGDKAPAFSGPDQDGKKHSLSDYKGKKLAIYFYPEDDSPTCTIQSCNLRDHSPALALHGIQVLGISPDDEKSHARFIKKFNLPFPLLADVNHKILEKYGVWDKKKMFGHEYMGVLRTTFLVDEKGIIRKIFTRPKNKDHAAEILKSFGF